MNWVAIPSFCKNARIELPDGIGATTLPSAEAALGAEPTRPGGTRCWWGTTHISGEAIDLLKRCANIIGVQVNRKIAPYKVNQRWAL
jgi:hypothetical protein